MDTVDIPTRHSHPTRRHSRDLSAEVHLSAEAVGVGGQSTKEEGGNPPKKSAKSKPKRSDFDSPWKIIIDKYFQDFMALCWPEKHALIDWNKGYKMLEQALLKIDKDAVVGNKSIDKLIEIHCKTGEVAYLILHLEIQRGREADFTKRMFRYRYRLMDLHDKPIASLAVLIDNDPKWRPGVYRDSLWDSWIEMGFPIMKITDYEARRAELEVSTNRFAPVILAQLAMNQHRDPSMRLGIKIALTRGLYRKGWSKNDVLSLYSFIDWLVMLPKELELTYTENVMKIEEGLKVHYVTTAERVGIRKGLQQGLEQGREEAKEYVTTAERMGIQKGRAEIREGMSAVLLRLLESKFGTVPDEYRQKIQEADSMLLLEWTAKFVDSPSLEALFKD